MNVKKRERGKSHRTVFECVLNGKCAPFFSGARVCVCAGRVIKLGWKQSIFCNQIEAAFALRSSNGFRFDGLLVIRTCQFKNALIPLISWLRVNKKKNIPILLQIHFELWSLVCGYLTACFVASLKKFLQAGWGKNRIEFLFPESRRIIWEMIWKKKVK